ncbi:MAG: FAD-dependent oxidoreductase [Alphaproteobacteria bacterium]|nr:FAD-dependent oxidoreductase [Alphaproteobacteria bacterium]MBT7943159.1 FAD-dependent oxidoreductase [Alphaproteobacteria bacterium]
MSRTPPNKARVVIIGGGVIGCSIAYHLTKIGWSDVVVLERKKLTSGTTWHAAGLIGQLRDNRDMTKLAKYTAELYAGLEAETGQATGFKQNGSLSIATHEGRFEDLKRRADMAKVFGLKVDVVGPDECKDLYPLANVDDVLGGIFLPSDGQANPTDVTMALAKGARSGGAQFFEDTKVTAINHSDGRVSGVETDAGAIEAPFVVLAAGMWSRDIAATLGVTVPLHACEHFYIVTESFDGVTPDLPVFRDYDAQAYYKEDAGKMLLGAFETVAKPWGMDGIPEEFCFDQLPDDFDHFQPILEMALHRMPALEHAGIQTFFNGPESFTPDNRYHLGEAPGMDGLFVAAGLNSIGIQSAGGVGKVLAQWMRDGLPPADLWTVDIRRNMPFQGDPEYLRQRVTETLGRLYAVHWPFHQPETARDMRLTPFHDRLAVRGACFSEAQGWERPGWYAPDGVAPEYVYSFKRQNWFEYSANEHRAVRENVGLFDQTSFSKFELRGDGAEAVLNTVCANDIAVEPGRIVYTQWLNERGGIEADLTVTRLARDRYWIISGAASQVRDFHWLKRHIPAGADAALTDSTEDWAVLGVMGPNSRALMQNVTDADCSNAAFPYQTSAETDISGVRVQASRITYVGELGWELYIPVDGAHAVFDVVVEAGRDHGLVFAGVHAMNSLRIEKAYRHWGHDIGDQDTPLEAGLGFAVAWDKPGGFIGRDALLKQKGDGITRRLVQVCLQDPEPLLYGNEPIWRDGEIVGSLTTAMYGHTLGGAVGLGYVENTDGGAVSANYINAGGFEVEVAGLKFAATVSIRPLYDPQGDRVRA